MDIPETNSTVKPVCDTFGTYQAGFGPQGIPAVQGKVMETGKENIKKKKKEETKRNKKTGVDGSELSEEDRV